MRDARALKESRGLFIVLLNIFTRRRVFYLADNIIFYVRADLVIMPKTI